MIGAPATAQAESPAAGAARRVPPHVFFLVSAVFHYLGPAFAVLLFAHVAPLGVASLRIATAAVVFATVGAIEFLGPIALATPRVSTG